MFARKENKEYKVNDAIKIAYLNDGYDIYDDNGEIIEYSPKKKITINEHLKEVAELKEEYVKEIAELNDALVKANEVPKNATELKKVNAELTATNEALVKEVEELKAQVETLTKVGENNGQVQE